MQLKKFYFLFIGVILTFSTLLAQKNTTGEATFNYTFGHSALRHTAVLNDHIYAWNFNQQFFFGGSQVSYLLKLDTNLNVVDSLFAGDIACEFCIIGRPIKRTDSTLWVLLTADSVQNTISGNNLGIMLELGKDLQILDTLNYSFSDLRGGVLDISELNDTLLVTGTNGFPFYSVHRKSDFSVIDDSLIADVDFFREDPYKPLFWNNHWNFMTWDRYLRFWQVSKGGHLDTIVNLFDPNAGLPYPYIPLRLLPGNSPEKAKLIGSGGIQFELYDVNLKNYSFTLRDSFPLNLPTARIQGITFLTSVDVEKSGTHVDWHDLNNIYIGATQGATFNFRDLKPGDTTLKRFIHLYKIDSAGNTKWYRRLGDESYYHFMNLTAHASGVYITGIKYNWKNPPNDHVTDGFIMSVNEKGEVIGMREVSVPVEQLTAYPNPAANLVTLKGMPKISTPFQYRIHNTEGQLMRQGTTSGEISVKELAKGTYWIILNHPDNNWQGTSKVMKN